MPRAPSVASKYVKVSEACQKPARSKQIPSMDAKVLTFIEFNSLKSSYHRLETEEEQCNI